MVSMPKMVADNREKMSEELKRIYGVPKIVENIKGADKGFDPVWAVDAVDHSVTSAYPKPRYTTTPIGTMIYFVSSYFSDW